MKKTLVLFIIFIILLAGCAFAEEQIEFSGKEAKKEIEKYLAAHSNILLITIESIPKEIDSPLLI